MHFWFFFLGWRSGSVSFARILRCALLPKRSYGEYQYNRSYIPKGRLFKTQNLVTSSGQRLKIFTFWNFRIWLPFGVNLELAMFLIRKRSLELFRMQSFNSSYYFAERQFLTSCIESQEYEITVVRIKCNEFYLYIQRLNLLHLFISNFNLNFLWMKIFFLGSLPFLY